ncbi:MAG: nitrate reductase [Desulfobacterales bacterium CG07_land_8_20_14_0_80_52_14]|nr:MAG: nitrate reductase [Desulfobacterales bacterium CG23_combo_of_CG06-09_8_20_14_all_52_9]PIU49099.1 MAG: nitrate reductase [Desulfobacterales bacterium CG07_land_8_20_14_0_80_52_14]
MNDIYQFVSGPLAWVAFILFIGGSLYRVIAMIAEVKKKEPFIFTYMSLKYSLRSILHWITPFATYNWRRKPVLTVVTFAFHICLFVSPIFLLAHVTLWDESWNIRWWTLPDGSADIMTLIVMASCVFFLVRRLTQREVQFVTFVSDYIILGIVAAPFITGFLAYHQWFGYPILMILHVLAGEVMLVAIPFTRLSHMLFSPFTRAYMGSEFGVIRKSKDY